ncbi:hypothetical protein ACFWEB_13345 [Streptomyces parvus]|uniref:hypothetical protein n=1 Tax=Streptomyces parvus TaxID=66428 RepID=UPI0036522A6D
MPTSVADPGPPSTASRHLSPTKQQSVEQQVSTHQQLALFIRTELGTFVCTPTRDVKVTVLHVNAAYLSALKVWLPIGKLEHTPGSDGRARSREEAARATTGPEA